MSMFSPISFAQFPQYHKLLNLCGSRASDYSFANIWGWAPYYELEWRFDGDLCWIRQNKPFACYWAPVGAWEAVTDWKARPEMSPGAHFIRVPEALSDLWKAALGERIELREARGQWDYLYLASDLILLPGNRFHKKKNLFKQFERLYRYEYSPITAGDVETVLNMQTEWCRWRDCESSGTLLAENDAVARVLTHWQDIPGLCGGLIRIDNVPVAYTVGEPLCDDTLIIHFEKGAAGIKGIYQAVNRLFAADAGKDFTYINREQDLDDEGLRQAKDSYHPVGFSRKCTATIL